MPWTWLWSVMVLLGVLAVPERVAAACDPLTPVVVANLTTVLIHSNDWQPGTLCIWQFTCGAGHYCAVSFPSFDIGKSSQIRVYSLDGGLSQVASIDGGQADNTIVGIGTVEAEVRLFPSSAADLKPSHFFEVAVSSIPSVACGDGVLHRYDGEVCDDGNLRNGDGCSSTCTAEPGFICSTAHAGPCGASDCKTAVVLDASAITALSYRESLYVNYAQGDCTGELADLKDDVTEGELWYKLDNFLACPPGHGYDSNTVALHTKVPEVDHHARLYSACPDDDGDLACGLDRSGDSVYLRVTKYDDVIVWYSYDTAWVQLDQQRLCTFLFLDVNWTDSPSVVTVVIASMIVFSAATVALSRRTFATTLANVSTDDGNDKDDSTAVGTEGEAEAEVVQEPYDSDDLATVFRKQSVSAGSSSSRTPAKLVKQFSSIEDPTMISGASSQPHIGEKITLAVQSIGDHSVGSSMLLAPRGITLADADVFFRARLTEAADLGARERLEVHVGLQHGWSEPLDTQDEHDNQVWRHALAVAVAAGQFVPVRVFALRSSQLSLMTAVFALADWTTDVILLATVAYASSLSSDAARVLFGPLILGVTSLLVAMVFGAYQSSRMLRSFMQTDPDFRESVQAQPLTRVTILSILTLLGACNLEALGVIRAYVPAIGLKFRLLASSRSRLTLSSWFTTLLEDGPQFVMQIWLLRLLQTEVSTTQLASLGTTAVMFLVSGYRRFATWRDIRRRKLQVTRARRNDVAVIKDCPLSVLNVLSAADFPTDTPVPLESVRVAAGIWPSGDVRVVDVDVNASMLDVLRRVMPGHEASGHRPPGLFDVCCGRRASDKVTAADVARHARYAPVTIMVAQSGAADIASAHWVAVEGDRRFWNWRLAKAAERPDQPLAILLSDRRRGQIRPLGQLESVLVTLWWYAVVCTSVYLAPTWMFLIVPLELVTCLTLFVYLGCASGNVVRRALVQLDLSSVLLAMLMPTRVMERLVSLCRGVGPMSELQEARLVRIRATQPHVMVMIAHLRLLGILVFLDWSAGIVSLPSVLLSLMFLVSIAQGARLGHHVVLLPTCYDNRQLSL